MQVEVYTHIENNYYLYCKLYFRESIWYLKRVLEANHAKSNKLKLTILTITNYKYNILNLIIPKILKRTYHAKLLDDIFPPLILLYSNLESLTYDISLSDLMQ